MKLMLSAFAKTVPHNYEVQGIELDSGLAPGASVTEEQWEKAKRMESEYWDWDSYMRLQTPVVEHPQFAARAELDKIVAKWEDLLQDLEPLPRLP